MATQRVSRTIGKWSIASGVFAILIALTGVVLHLVFNKGVYIGATGEYAPTWLILTGGGGIAAAGILLVAYGALSISLSMRKRPVKGAIVTVSR